MSKNILIFDLKQTFWILNKSLAINMPRIQKIIMIGNKNQFALFELIMTGTVNFWWAKTQPNCIGLFVQRGMVSHSAPNQVDAFSNVSGILYSLSSGNSCWDCLPRPLILRDTWYHSISFICLGVFNRFSVVFVRLLEIIRMY